MTLFTSRPSTAARPPKPPRGARFRLPPLWRTPLAIIGVVITLAWVVVAVSAPLWVPYSPVAQDLPRLQPPGAGTLLGTDALGRDVFSRLMSGAGVTIPLALLLVAAAVVVGTVVGAAAGYLGGWVDEVLMRLTDLVMAFPTVILAMVIAASLGPSLFNAVIAAIVVSWPQYARVTRSLVLGLRGQNYVVAGRLLGRSPFTSLMVDIAPNIVGPVLVLATLDIGAAILLLSGLSFLGLGAQPPTAEWGSMISAALQNFDAWWIGLFPGLAILTVVMAFNFLGDSLRDALDPTSRVERTASGVAAAPTEEPGRGPRQDGDRVSILTIDGLTVDLGRPVVRGVSLSLEAGRIQGLAGESGSGKTITSLATLGLLPRGATTGGSIRLGDMELVGLGEKALNRVRGARIAMVFQDPSSSLHPQLRIGRQLTDHMRGHLRLDRKAARARAVELLERVRVPDAQAALARYPHQFSGGQRQRIAIAIALACDPEVLLADEPTTALDVTVQAGVLRLLRDLADERRLAVLLVTHDLGVMSAIADDVAVMRAGRIVESGTREQVFLAPRDDYTKELLAALPGSAFEQTSTEGTA